MLCLLHDASMGLPTLMCFSEWLLLMIENCCWPQCQFMLIPTALHNENAVKKCVLWLSLKTLSLKLAVTKPAEVQAPRRCPDLAAQNANVAGID